jgi:2-octaprenyl-6-methoxyphenol hydroxylase
MQQHFDIAIVGAGLVGSSLACALASTPYRIALIDSQPLPAIEPADVNSNSLQDGRSIALALSSKKMFDVLGLWQSLDADAVPIKKIHISDQGRFGAARLDSARYDVESFGYLVPAEKLITALQQKIQLYDHIQRVQPYEVSNLESQTDQVILNADGEPIHAKLLIAADGIRSLIRNKLGIGADEKQYQQSAIVGCIDTEIHHQFTAYERFTKDGPLALLPRNGNRCGFIWMNPSVIAEKNLNLSDEGFLEELQQAFGQRLGHFSNLSRRFAYPLSLLVSDQRVQQRVVLVGNAAQTLHPVAGQGLNLALRDIAELSEILVSSENALDNIDEALRAYEACRQPDIENTVRFTDRLNFLFTADYPVLSRTRGLGLALLGAIPALEERIVRQNLGTLGSAASLLQGRALRAEHV